jgi:predicted PurR-regulated permease PerM
VDIVTSDSLRKALPLFTALAVGVLILVIASILYFGQEIFVPFALGILLSFVLAPIVIGLQKLNIPRGLAITGAIVVASIVILLIAGIIASQIAGLAGNLPKYRATMQQKLESFAAPAKSAPSGPLARAVEALQGIAADIQMLVQGAGTIAGEPAPPQPLHVVVDNSGNGTLSVFSAVISPLLGPLTTIGIVIIFAVFILLQREDLRNRFIRLVGTDDLQQTTAAIDDAARRLSRLLLFQFAVNAGFGLIIGVGLYLIGVPSPFLWGILGGVLRFVPYIGGFIAAGLPMALAFAVDPGWSMVLWTAALFVIVETALSNIVEPVLYGHSTGLSPVAILVAALIWALLWGPVGLILATPLTICLVVMGRHIPRLAFIDVMFGDRPVLSPPQIFYQRMLAGAPQEAALQAREFLRGRALVTYYDEVALDAMRLAHEDVARFAVKDERLDVLRATTLDLVARLGKIKNPLPRGGALRAEAAAAVDAVGPDSQAARIVRMKAELAPEWRAATPVICISGNDPLDEPVAAMLTQVLTKHGLNTRLVTRGDLEEKNPTLADTRGVALVCLSFLEPLSTVHLRLAVRRVHKIVPSARILIGIWRQRDPAMVQELRKKVHADALVTTLTAALAAVLEMSGTSTGTAATASGARSAEKARPIEPAIA